MLSTKLKTGILFLLITGLFLSCKQDIEKINALMTTLDLPDQSGKDLELHYSENGVLKRIFKTPEMERYNESEKDFYLLFPQGIEVYVYNDSLELESTIEAGYAEYHSDTDIWEVRYDVVAQRISTGDQINSEKMFWDQTKKIIYSDVFTKITNDGGTYIGESGFEADENMEYYSLKGASGTVNVNDESEEE